MAGITLNAQEIVDALGLHIRSRQELMEALGATEKSTLKVRLHAVGNVFTATVKKDGNDE